MISNKSNKETQAARVRKVVQITALLEYLVNDHLYAHLNLLVKYNNCILICSRKYMLNCLYLASFQGIILRIKKKELLERIIGNFKGIIIMCLSLHVAKASNSLLNQFCS